MKLSKSLSVLFVGGAVLLFAACSVSQPVGSFYTNATTPTAVSATGTGNASKKGEASCTNILGLVALGDCSTSKAAENGNIKNIKSVDHKLTTILGFYGKNTTIVTGE